MEEYLTQTLNNDKLFAVTEQSFLDQSSEISHGTPDDLSRYTSVSWHSGWKTLP